MNTEPQLSNDPLKNRVIQNLIKSRTPEQIRNSMNYAKLARLDKDEVVMEWYQFKMALTVKH